MRYFIYTFLLLSMFCASSNGQHIESNTTPAERVTGFSDHHVHIMSPQLISLWKGMGIPFSRQDHFYSHGDSILKATGADAVSLISMAYVYSSAEFGGGAVNIRDNIQAENGSLAREKGKYPDRIKAYYGIDPLYEFALDEIQRCHRELKLDGIKLHFNASQVYLTEPEHRAIVRTIFQYASDNRIPVLLHFDNGHPKFGNADVEILADSVLRNLAYVDLQIAHFGTSGGFNQKTKHVLESFIELFDNDHPIAQQNIRFDISGVCLDKDADGVSRLTNKDFEDLGVYCRKLGFTRIVFGSDYPLYNSMGYLDVLKTKLNLTKSEIDDLLNDK